MHYHRMPYGTQHTGIYACIYIFIIAPTGLYCILFCNVVRLSRQPFVVYQHRNINVCNVLFIGASDSGPEVFSNDVSNKVKWVPLVSRQWFITLCIYPLQIINSWQTKGCITLTAYCKTLRRMQSVNYYVQLPHLCQKRVDTMFYITT